MQVEVRTQAEFEAAISAGDVAFCVSGSFRLVTSGTQAPRVILSAEAKLSVEAWGSSQPHVEAWGMVQHWIRQRLPNLRGKQLACWCPLDQPCHADVLAEIANKSIEQGAA